jgi:hypothetical protein
MPLLPSQALKGLGNIDVILAMKKTKSFFSVNFQTGFNGKCKKDPLFRKAFCL